MNTNVFHTGHLWEIYPLLYKYQTWVWLFRALAAGKASSHGKLASGEGPSE